MRSSALRSLGWEGGGASDEGGGGRGALLASPMRRRVIVSWAFVGTPLRIVLEGSLACLAIEAEKHSLSEFYVFLPIRKLFIEQLDRADRYRVTEETDPGE